MHYLQTSKKEGSAMGKKKTVTLIGGMAVVIATAGILAACSAQSQPADSAATGGQTSEVAAAEGSPIIEAAHWQDQFPNEYKSYLESGKATYAHGPGASGKVNSHLDVMDPPADYPADFGTGCLSCHSSGYQTEVMDVLGEDLFTTDPETVKGLVSEGITCYSCHGNTPGQLTPVNKWFIEAAEKGGVETSEENMVCGQCHALGDFTVQFSDPDSSKWSTLQGGVEPEKLWEYLKGNGNQTPTVPSAEIVFNNYLGSTHDKAGATCADCHIEQATDESGSSYAKHQWQSVGTNENLYANCESCHNDSAADRKAALEKVQGEFTARAAEVKAVIDSLSQKIDERTQAGSLSEEQLAQATELFNEATFYLSYGSDQSLGYHNMGNGSATAGCMDLAQQTAQKGLDLLA